MALRHDDEIDDLLNLMGGGGQASTSAAVPPAASLSKIPRKSSKDGGKEKKRKKKRKEIATDDKSDAKKRRAKQRQTTSYADTRLTQNCFAWPHSPTGRWLSLGPGLLRNCRGYECDATSDRYGAAPCASCGRSGASHELRQSYFKQEAHVRIYDEEDEVNACRLLVSIVVASRNARCLMGEHFPLAKGVHAEGGMEKVLPSLGSEVFNHKSVPGLMRNCRGYECDATSDRYGAAPCASCGRSGASHELRQSYFKQEAHVDDEGNEVNACRLLVSIVVASRNARCLMGEHFPLAKGVNAQGCLENVEVFNHKSVSENLDAILGKILKCSNEMKRIHRFFSDEDVALLGEKVSALIHAAGGYKTAVLAATSPQSVAANTSDATNILVERRLAAMAACDIVYYRCYYMMAVAKHTAVEGLDLAAMMPHPPTYFSCPGLAWDAVDAGLASLRVFLGESGDSKVDDLAAPLDDATRQTLLKSWGLEDRLSSTPNQATNNTLLTLWQSRFMETIRHVWATRYSQRKASGALRSAIADNRRRDSKARHSGQESLLRIHETSALSDAMAQWRDAVRDYPANFYAYAAPTEEALRCISECFDSSGVDQILEAGAGTGYWSALLLSHLKRGGGKSNTDEAAQDSVPLVVPYDIAPPSTMENGERHGAANEYHGEIPSFTPVQKADSLRQMLSASAPSGSGKRALLLCYPPPGSDMACKALTSYVASGGSIVMHVGEWQGLTGDSAFEHSLRRNFYCLEKDVVPLPMWGTDATYLTIWRKRESEDLDNTQSANTVSCSPALGYCSVEDCSSLAERRCRYARCLQYCSVECYQKHCSRRRSILALHMIHTSSSKDAMKYDDDTFLDLRQSSLVANDSSESERPRKKRKKKRR